MDLARPPLVTAVVSPYRRVADRDSKGRAAVALAAPRPAPERTRAGVGTPVQPTHTTRRRQVRADTALVGHDARPPRTPRLRAPSSRPTCSSWATPALASRRWSLRSQTRSMPRTRRHRGSLTGTRARAPASRAGAYQWADLMRRTFGVDVLACPRCGGRRRLVALIEQASVIQRILRHLGFPTHVPEARPARAPPRAFDPTDDRRTTRPNSTRLVRAWYPVRRGVARGAASLPRRMFSLPFSADLPKIAGGTRS